MNAAAAPCVVILFLPESCSLNGSSMTMAIIAFAY